MGAGASTGCNSANAKMTKTSAAQQMTKTKSSAIEVAQLTKSSSFEVANRTKQMTKQLTQTLLQPKARDFQLHIIAIARDATTGLLGIGLNDDNYVLEPGTLATAAGLQAFDKVIKLDETALEKRKLAEVMAETARKDIHVFTVHRYDKGRIRLSTGTPPASFRGRASVHAAPPAAAPASAPVAAAPAAAAPAIAAEPPASAAAGVGTPAVFTVEEPTGAPAAASLIASALRPITNRVRLSGASKAEVAPDPTAPVEPHVAVAPLASMAPLPPIMAAA